MIVYKVQLLRMAITVYKLSLILFTWNYIISRKKKWFRYLITHQRLKCRRINFHCLCFSSLKGYQSVYSWIFTYKFSHIKKQNFTKINFPLQYIYIYIYIYIYTLYFLSVCYTVGWGCRIHRLLLCRGVAPPSNECPGYDTKQSDGEVPAILELWGMRSTPSLPSLPGPLWSRVVAPDIYGLNWTNSILMLNWIVWVNWIAWNRNVFDN